MPTTDLLKFTAVPADTLPMGDSQGGERILPLENKPKLSLGEVSNHRKEFPAGTPVKFIFGGTPPLAATVLQALLEAHYRPLAVYTQPDKPAGRGRHLTESPVKTLALKHHIPVEQPSSLKSEEAAARLKSYDAHLWIVVAYGLLLPESILKIPTRGCINLHVSLLPRWRGAAPIQHAILAGDTTTGVTLMEMDPGLDTGPILAQVPCPILPTDTSGTLHDKLATVGAQCLLKFLKEFENKPFHGVPQENDKATYAPKISKEEARISWSDSAESILRAIRAYNPMPGAHTVYKNQSIKIWEASLGEPTTSHAPGTLCRIDKNHLWVATGKGILQIHTLQLPGGKALPLQTLLNGHAHFFEEGVLFGVS